MEFKRIFKEVSRVVFGDVNYDASSMSVSNEYLEENKNAKQISSKIQNLWKEEVTEKNKSPDQKNSSKK